MAIIKEETTIDCGIEKDKKRKSGCVNIISYVTIERFVYRLK